MGEFNRIDRLLTGEPLTIGERTIWPAARLSGWVGGWSGPQGGGGGGWVQLRPVEVIVHGTDGAEQRVPIVDARTQAWRRIAAAGLAVAGACIALMALRGLAPRAQ